MLIERSTAALNDNVNKTDDSNIAMLLTVPRVNNNTRNNNRRDTQGKAVTINLAWVPLDQDENNSITATKKFAAHGPTFSASSGSSFMQRNNPSKRHN